MIASSLGAVIVGRSDDRVRAPAFAGSASSLALTGAGGRVSGGHVVDTLKTRARGGAPLGRVDRPGVGNRGLRRTGLVPVQLAGDATRVLVNVLTKL